MTTTIMDERRAYLESAFEHSDAAPLAIRFRIFPRSGLRALASRTILYHQADPVAHINPVGSAHDLYYINEGRLYLNAPSPSELPHHMIKLIQEVDQILSLLIPNAKLSYGKMSGFSLPAFCDPRGLKYDPYDQYYIDLAATEANCTFAAMNVQRQRYQLNLHKDIHLRRHGHYVTRYQNFSPIDGFTPSDYLAKRWTNEIIRVAKASSY